MAARVLDQQTRIDSSVEHKWRVRGGLERMEEVLGSSDRNVAKTVNEFFDDPEHSTVTDWVTATFVQPHKPINVVIANPMSSKS
jgi:hypothetical protein